MTTVNWILHTDENNVPTYEKNIYRKWNNTNLREQKMNPQKDEKIQNNMTSIKTNMKNYFWLGLARCEVANYYCSRPRYFYIRSLRHMYI